MLTNTAVSEGQFVLLNVLLKISFQVLPRTRHRLRAAAHNIQRHPPHSRDTGRSARYNKCPFLVRPSAFFSCAMRWSAAPCRPCRIYAIQRMRITTKTSRIICRPVVPKGLLHSSACEVANRGRHRRRGQSCELLKQSWPYHWILYCEQIVRRKCLAWPTPILRGPRVMSTVDFRFLVLDCNLRVVS